MYWHDGSYGTPILMFLLLLVLFGAIAALVVWVVTRSKTEGPAPRQGASSAMAILEERFARGEIDAQEFQERRAFLEGRPAGDTQGPAGGQGSAGD